MRKDLMNLGAVLVLYMHGHLDVAAGARGSSVPGPSNRPSHASPTALAATEDGRCLFIACTTDPRVAVFDLAASQVTRSIPVPASPSGLALSKDGTRLYVTCASAASTVCVIRVATGQILEQIPAGHTAMAPVLSPDEQTLYVCNRFNNEVAFIDLTTGKEAKRVMVQREPVAADITPDGKVLVVANHLPNRRADGSSIAAGVSIIDTTAGKVRKHVRLGPGSGLLRGVAVSPDGRYAAVTHNRAAYYMATDPRFLPLLNRSIVSLVSLEALEVRTALTLDTSDGVTSHPWGPGAANPWAVAWSHDGTRLIITSAGTHELHIVDVQPYLAYGGLPPKRIDLPGKGPRALALVGSRCYVANYFSDNLSVLDLASPDAVPVAIELSPASEPSLVRKGEAWFNDATLCDHYWQSCASCHDSDARVDGFNWDLLNDGTGNPKNAKSLLWAHRTPPAMSLGVRPTAEAAVRAGLRHILLAAPSEDVAVAIDEYLKSLRPLPSPYLTNGRLSPSAERGRRMFMEPEVRCAQCHPPDLFTDLRPHDVGTAGQRDQPQDRFDTPTLVELWRTAPYLHDGSAATIRDVLTTSNSRDLHGKTSHLTPEETDDLAAYLLSL